MRYSVFAMELCGTYEPQSQLRRQLTDLIVTHPERAGLHDKWDLYQRTTTLLLSQLHAFEYGCWDFFDDSLAESKYQEWCGGLVLEEGVRKTPSVDFNSGYFRQPNDVRYMTFTMAFLLAYGTSSERAFAQRCNIPQAQLWKRDVFASLLHGLKQINFANVRSDVVYMIPNNDNYGLTPQDLGSGKFHYLRKLG